MRVLRFGAEARYMIRFGWLDQPYLISRFAETARAAEDVTPPTGS